MRRCSFSSAVFARLRGGKFVLGSGRTWPHDLRFFVVFPSDGLGVSAEADVSSDDDDDDLLGVEHCSSGMMVCSRSSILMV